VNGIEDSFSTIQMDYENSFIEITLRAGIK